MTTISTLRVRKHLTVKQAKEILEVCGITLHPIPMTPWEMVKRKRRWVKNRNQTRMPPRQRKWLTPPEVENFLREYYRRMGERCFRRAG